MYSWCSLRPHESDRTILVLVAEGDVKQAMEGASTSRHPVALHKTLGLGPEPLQQAGQSCW
jgi:hypothetical protein